VVVHDSTSSGPFVHKTDPVLVIHPNAVLPGAVSSERFQAVPADRGQILEDLRGIKPKQADICRFFDGPEPSTALPIED
jgi:hypothetical protein